MKEIQTNGITLLLVEVPEDVTGFNLHHNILLYPLGNDDVDGIRLPIGQYQILGKSTELSEEQMKEICATRFNGANYHDYLKENVWFKTVQESYLSLLEANGIVDRNNLANPDTTTILGSSPSGIYYEVLDELRDKWQESQSKVKHYLVLKRI